MPVLNSILLWRGRLWRISFTIAFLSFGGRSTSPNCRKMFGLDGGRQVANPLTSLLLQSPLLYRPGSRGLVDKRLKPAELASSPLVMTWLGPRYQQVISSVGGLRSRTRIQVQILCRGAPLSCVRHQWSATWSLIRSCARVELQIAKRTTNSQARNGLCSHIERDEDGL